MGNMVYDPDGPGIPAYGINTPYLPSKVRPKKSESFCRFNSGVLCDDWVCESCGFNPERKRGKDG